MRNVFVLVLLLTACTFEVEFTGEYDERYYVSDIDSEEFDPEEAEPSHPDDEPEVDWPCWWCL